MKTYEHGECQTQPTILGLVFFVRIYLSRKMHIGKRTIYLPPIYKLLFLCTGYIWTLLTKTRSHIIRFTERNRKWEWMNWGTMPRNRSDNQTFCQELHLTFQNDDKYRNGSSYSHSAANIHSKKHPWQLLKPQTNHRNFHRCFTL